MPPFSFSVIVHHPRRNYFGGLFCNKNNGFGSKINGRNFVILLFKKLDIQKILLSLHTVTFLHNIDNHTYGRLRVVLV